MSVTHYQAIVVGGGAAGLSAALGLQSAGAKTLCLASDSPPALLAAAGMLLPALDDFLPSIQSAADWSYAAWSAFGERLGLGGSLHTCNVSHFQGIRPSLVQAFEGRVVNTRDLYAACLGQLRHVVSAQAVRCVFENGIYQVTDVLGQRYSCDWLFLATGYSDVLPQCHGFTLPGAADLPRSVRGITLRCQNVALDSILYWKKDPRTVIYMAPWFDGTLVIGSTVNVDDTDTAWRTEEEMALLNLANELLPEVAQAIVIERRVGLRPLCDAHNIGFMGLDTTEAPRVWWINGLFRNGILWMPACAELAANLYGQKSWSSALSGFVQRPHTIAA